MRKTLKLIITAALVIFITASLAVTCFANYENGKITVALTDKEKNSINGLAVSVCQVASLSGSGYYPTAAFEASGISLSGIVNNPDEVAAKSIYNYIKENGIDGITQVSEEGKASFSGLELGIWLVFCEEGSKYAFNPYIVFLPLKSGGKLYYEVSSAPKVENGNPDEISIYVMKKWDDNNNGANKRPQEITVELLCNGSVIDTAVLNSGNGWAYTFTASNKEGSYSVEETPVADYEANYSGDAANGFVITNSYIGDMLPGTGQHWWPIAVIAVAGTCFIALGIWEIGAKKNGKAE